MSNRVDLSTRPLTVTVAARGTGRAKPERFLRSGAFITICDCDGAVAGATPAALDGQGRVAACEVDAERPDQFERICADTVAVDGFARAAARTAPLEQTTQTHIDHMLSRIPRRRFVTLEGGAAMDAFYASAGCSLMAGPTFDLSCGQAIN